MLPVVGGCVCAIRTGSPGYKLSGQDFFEGIVKGVRLNLLLRPL